METTIKSQEAAQGSEQESVADTKPVTVQQMDEKDLRERFKILIANSDPNDLTEQLLEIQSGKAAGVKFVTLDGKVYTAKATPLKRVGTKLVPSAKPRSK